MTDKHSTPKTDNTISRDECVTLPKFWKKYSGLLWENGKHKDNCDAFIHEISEYMQMQKIYDYDDVLIDKLVIYFRSQGNQNSTINRKLSALYRLLKKAERSGEITRLPSYVRLREKNSRVRFLTADEEQDMFSSVGRFNEHHELLCRFLVDSGARIGEALALKWNDIHNHNATFWITKSGKSRTVPLTERAVEAVDSARIYGGSGPFSTISYANFKYNWNRARKENRFTDDPNMVPHILRHTCASRLVQAGIDLRRVQTFLGHQTIQITLRYAHLATNDLDQCVVALNAANQTAKNKRNAAIISAKSEETNAQPPKSASPANRQTRRTRSNKPSTAKRPHPVEAIPH